MAGVVQRLGGQARVDLDRSGLPFGPGHATIGGEAVRLGVQADARIRRSADRQREPGGSDGTGSHRASDRIGAIHNTSQRIFQRLRPGVKPGLGFRSLGAVTVDDDRTTSRARRIDRNSDDPRIGAHLRRQVRLFGEQRHEVVGAEESGVEQRVKSDDLAAALHPGARRVQKELHRGRPHLEVVPVSGQVLPVVHVLRGNPTLREPGVDLAVGHTEHVHAVAKSEVRADRTLHPEREHRFQADASRQTVHIPHVFHLEFNRRQQRGGRAQRSGRHGHGLRASHHFTENRARHPMVVSDQCAGQRTSDQLGVAALLQQTSGDAQPANAESNVGERRAGDGNRGLRPGSLTVVVTTLVLGFGVGEAGVSRVDRRERRASRVLESTASHRHLGKREQSVAGLQFAQVVDGFRRGAPAAGSNEASARQSRLVLRPLQNLVHMTVVIGQNLHVVAERLANHRHTELLAHVATAGVSRLVLRLVERGEPTIHAACRVDPVDALASGEQVGNTRTEQDILDGLRLGGRLRRCSLATHARQVHPNLLRRAGSDNVGCALVFGRLFFLVGFLVGFFLRSGSLIGGFRRQGPGLRRQFRSESVALRLLLVPLRLLSSERLNGLGQRRQRLQVIGRQSGTVAEHAVERGSGLVVQVFEFVCVQGAEVFGDHQFAGRVVSHVKAFLRL